MVNESRIAIYDYLSGMMKAVTPRVYSMAEPEVNTEADVDEGFLVVRVGTLNDDSEFSGNAYMWARCYVTAYVPKKTNGRLDKERYKTYEDGVNDVIRRATATKEGTYYILPDSTVSMDDDESAQKGNQYHVFTKSFVVVVDNIEE